MSYKVKLGYQNFNQRRTTLYTGLTLKEAQQITSDKEASWKTCTKKYLKRRTKEKGPWFLMLTEE